MISVRQISFSWSHKPLLQEISLDVASGTGAVIVGPNGAGKSTLLKLMCGLLKPAGGEVLVSGQPLTAISQKSLARILGYVPQHFSTAFDFRAYDIVAMGRFAYLSPFSQESAVDRQKIREAMEETGVWEKRDQQFSQLSGGERQRLVLASTLAQEADVLLLDEPTNALDIRHQIEFYRLLTRLRREKNLTIVAVTHDINLAVRYFDRMIILNEGAIVADGAPDKVLTSQLLESVYGIRLQTIGHPEDGKPMLLLP